jgi:hypothetical protein
MPGLLQKLHKSLKGVRGGREGVFDGQPPCSKELFFSSCRAMGRLVPGRRDRAVTLSDASFVWQHFFVAAQNDSPE